MIRTAPVASQPTPAPATIARSLGPTPLAGPDRHADPVRAMRQDLDDIVAGKGSVEEDDLTMRGWSIGEVIEHLPAARRLGRQAAP